MKQALRANKLTQRTQPITDSATDSFESLYNQYVGKVYQKCLSFTKDSDTAQDFTQDIFIKVFTKMDSFENRSSFSTWLYAVSHHYCLDQVRINKRMNVESLSDRITSNVAEEEPLGTVEFQLQALEGVMKMLPPEEETILRLKYEQELSVKEIALRYDIKESAVKMRLKRSRDKLQTLYQKRSVD